MIHLLFLHQTGSNNPLGINSIIKKLPFNPYYTLKDFKGFIILFLIIIHLILFSPYLLRDPDNFVPANPIVTPTHIQPEWYFLFAYAILRSIPSKFGGVIALIMSIIILFFIPLYNFTKLSSLQFYPLNKTIFWLLTRTIILLTWIGIRPVEDPYIIVGQFLSVTYFLLFIINPLIFFMSDKLIK